MATDTEVILSALQKERDELHNKIMQVDRIIKRAKSLDYSTHTNDIIEPKSITNPPTTKQIDKPAPSHFSKLVDIKLQVLRVFDILKVASRLKDVQRKYNQLSDNSYDIRETVRSLGRSKLLQMVRVKDNNRGIYWVKSDWIKDRKLIDDYKPEGFDLLHRSEDIFFE